MDDRVGSLHCCGQGIGVFHVAPDNPEPCVAEMLLVMPFPSRREVVVNRYSGGCGIGEKTIRKMPSDKACAADDEIALRVCHFLMQLANVFNPNLCEKH